ncbi:MAG: hypothetical protein JW821_05300 [Deltaproteobacteria bacterium]|nr:hypothetical protein [Deltaproteobacteria bacterium]
MGKWTLKSIEGRFEQYDTSELFGTSLFVTYQLLYTPTIFGKFVETPKLEWLETIMMNEHHKGEHWTFQANMYTHNPLSETLKIWPRRYVEAYKDAYNRPFTGKGHAKLRDKNGAELAAGTLKSGITEDAKMADEVRKYLKDNGGILEIQIHDIPSINKPKGTGTERKERLLNFDCGVEGGMRRYRAQQYLMVVAGEPPHTWKRNFQVGWPFGLKTTGFREVPAPQTVSAPRPPLFFGGELW